MISQEKLDFLSKVPLYVQLFDLIKQAIVSEECKAGDLIWTESELCRIFGVSRVTVRQTTSLLIQEGFLVRKRGVGTFVAGGKIEQNLVKCYSFTADMRAMGKNPSSKVLVFEEAVADSGLSYRFKTNLGTKLWRLVRIRKADGIPVLLQEEFFVKNHFPDFENFLKEEDSLYAYMAKTYGLIFDRAEEHLVPIHIEKHAAELLETDPRSLGIRLERTLYVGGDIIGWGFAIARGDKFTYKVYYQ